jgi:hypothetical protein
MTHEHLKLFATCSKVMRPERFRYLPRGFASRSDRPFLLRTPVDCSTEIDLGGKGSTYLTPVNVMYAFFTRTMLHKLSKVSRDSLAPAESDDSCVKRAGAFRSLYTLKRAEGRKRWAFPSRAALQTHYWQSFKLLKLRKESFSGFRVSGLKPSTLKP